MNTLYLLLGIVCLLLVGFWIVQLLSLMNMEDAQFPGRRDKVLWFVLLMLGSVLGAVVFWLWKCNRRLEREISQEVGAMISLATQPGEKSSTEKGPASE